MFYCIKKTDSIQSTKFYGYILSNCGTVVVGAFGVAVCTQLVCCGHVVVDAIRTKGFAAATASELPIAVSDDAVSFHYKRRWCKYQWKL